jgi:predicted AAA+ superfamily ATPase
LQKDFDIKNDHTVENYVSYLYQAYLLMQVKKYSHKSNERIRNAKCYTVDVALMNARKEALAGENLGWRLETIVYLELKRRYSTGYDIYYLKENSFEADFVICKRSTVLEVIQVSYDIENAKTYKREMNGLLQTSKLTSCDKLKLITAYTDKQIEEQGKHIEIISCYKWLTQ